MKVKSRFLSFFHLDKTYSLLSGKNVKLLLEIFQLLDIHGTKMLNDIQFYCFVSNITNLSRTQIYKVFDMLDVDGSGELDFDEFYLLMCILIAVKDNDEKQFIYRHSRTVFDLLDEDGSNTISAHEFENFGFLFNLQGSAVKKIFNEFDVSGDQELDYKEFRMFAMACIDKQSEIENDKQHKLEKKRQKAYMKAQKKRGGLQRIRRALTVPSLHLHLPSFHLPGSHSEGEDSASVKSASFHMQGGSEGLSILRSDSVASTMTDAGNSSQDRGGGAMAAIQEDPEAKEAPVGVRDVSFDRNRCCIL